MIPYEAISGQYGCNVSDSLFAAKSEMESEKNIT